MTGVTAVNVVAMASLLSPSTLSGTTRTAVRRPWHPARKRLILGVGLIAIGSFLPWLYVGGMPKSGALGPGLWTFYASMLGIAAIMLPFHRIGSVHAGIVGAVALAVPAWQLVHVLGLVGFGGWMPGPGLVMVVAGGVVALGCAVRLWRAGSTPA